MKERPNAARRAWAIVAALGITTIFLLTAAPPTRAQGPMPTSYPFGYGTPVVSPLLGAQGSTGPTVPLAQVGVYGIFGAQGKQGPINETSPSRFHTVASTLTITVKNGTTTSSVNAAFQTVAAQNVTYGSWVSAKTSAAGVATLALTEGWWLLYTNTTTPASFIAGLQELDLLAPTVAFTRYVIPTSSSVLAINNGPLATRGVIWATALGSFGTGAMGHLPVQLLNASSGNAVLGTTYSLPNGSVEFTGVDNAFSYSLNMVGFGVNALDGVNYQMSTGGWGGFTVTAGAQVHTTQNNPTVGVTTTTGVLTGAALPTAGTNNRWNINVVTKVVGGTTSISAALSGTSVLQFINAQVYLNWSQESYNAVGTPNFYLNNSTLIVLTQDASGGAQATLSPTSIYATHARIFGQVQATSGVNGALLGFASCRWTWLENVWVGSYSFLYGALVNSTIANSTQVSLGAATSDGQTGAKSTSLSWSTVLNSSIVGGGTAKSFYLDHDFINQTDVTTNRFTSSFVNWSWVGSTSFQAWSSSDTSMGFIGTSTWKHDTLTYVLARNLVWSTWYTRASTTSTSWSFVNVNLSFTKVDVTQNGLVPIRTVAVLSNHLWLYDVWLDSNYSLPQLIRLTQVGNVTSNIARSGMLQVNANWNLWMNWTLVDLGGDGFISSLGGNATMVHDVWPWAWEGNAYNGFSLFSATPVGGKRETVVLANDTFNSIAYNSTVFFGFEKRLFGIVGTEWIYDTNIAQQANPIGTLAVNYTTFHGTPMGPANLFVSGDLLQGVNGVTAYVSHDVFLNEPSSSAMTASYRNGSFYRPPYAEDVIAVGGSTYVNDSAFLRLSNETAPVGENGGAQTSGSRPKVLMARDRFYYSPTPLQSSVDPTGPARTTQAAATPVDNWLSSIPSASTMTYEMPIDVNASMSYLLTGSDAYVWNTTTVQTNAVPTGSWNTPNNYAWGIAPDVDPISGTPVLDYANGVAAGPQPTFVFGAHTYLNSVEPTYANIASSAGAPTVLIEFSTLNPNTAYVVDEWNAANGSLVGAPTVVTNAAGVVSVAYTPTAGSPLNETFLVAPIPPATFLGLTPSSWTGISVILAIVALMLLLVAAERRYRD